MSSYSRKPRTASLPLVLDGELMSRIDQTRELLRLAQLAERVNPTGLDGEAPRLERQLNELIAEAAESATTFVVRALPGEDFDTIKLQHPPTAEMMEQYREQAKLSPFATLPEMNPTTMGPDLLVACLVEPDWEEDVVRGLWAELSKGEQNQLWNLALGVQVSGANLPLSRAATDTTGGGGELSTMSANGESH
jgi:hypothetical protein